MTNQNVTLTLTAQQLAVVSEALVGMPYRVAAPVIADLQRQLDEHAKSQSPNVVEMKDAV